MSLIDDSRLAWDHEKVVKLIEGVSKHYIKLKHRTTSSQKVWSLIVQELHALDDTITAEQAATKWKSLVQNFKKYVANMNLNKNARIRMKKPEFFDEIEGIIGDTLPEYINSAVTPKAMKYPKVERDASSTLKRALESIGVNETESEESDEANHGSAQVVTTTLRRKKRPPTRSALLQDSLSDLVREIKHSNELQAQSIELMRSQGDALVAAIKERNDILHQIYLKKYGGEHA